MIVTDVTDIGDPFILRDGEKYYMYATSAKDGFLYFWSDDLKNWVVPLQSVLGTRNLTKLQWLNKPLKIAKIIANSTVLTESK